MLIVQWAQWDWWELWNAGLGYLMAPVGGKINSSTSKSTEELDYTLQESYDDFPS